MSKRGWFDAAAESTALFASRPALLLVPAAAVAAGRMIALSSLGRLWAGFLLFAAFSAANAVFAEAWRALDGGFDGDRFFETVAVFLLPVPLFFAVSYLSSLAVYDDTGARMTAAWLQLFGMKALSVAVTVFAAVALPGLETAKGGALDALRRGAPVFARNLGPVLAAVIAALFCERLVGFLWREWRAFFGGSGASGAVRFARDWSLNAIPMFFGVALPSQAGAMGLLEDA